MNHDPLQRLRCHLVEAARRQAHDNPIPARHSKRAVWVGLAFAVIAVPAGAATTGVINLGSGSTPAGTSYTITRSEDDRASGDPTQTDGIGRTCEDVTYRDRDGNLQGASKVCRPRNATPPVQTLGVGYERTPDGYLLLKGGVSQEVAKVTVSGFEGDIDLIPDGNLQRFRVLTTTGSHEIAAYDSNGKLLDKTSIDAR